MHFFNTTYSSSYLASALACFVVLLIGLFSLQSTVVYADFTDYNSYLLNGVHDDGESINRKRNWYFQRPDTDDPAKHWRARKLEEYGSMKEVWIKEDEWRNNRTKSDYWYSYHFPCYREYCPCGVQYCRTRTGARGCVNFTEEYTFKDRLSTSKGKDLIMEEFCFNRSVTPNNEYIRPNDKLVGSCLVGKITVGLSSPILALKTLVIYFRTSRLILNDRKMNEEADQIFEYQFSIYPLPPSMVESGITRRNRVDLTGPLLTSGIDKVSGVREPDKLRSGTMELKLTKKGNNHLEYIDEWYTMQMKGELFLPLNMLEKSNSFVGEADFYVHKGSYDVWIGSENRGLAAEFELPFQAMYKQKMDKGLFAKIRKLEVLYIDRKLCELGE